MKRLLAPKLEPLKIPARVPFPVDEALVARQREAAKSCPVNQIKAVLCDGKRVLLEEHDYRECTTWQVGASDSLV
jgi:hypothetical protein